MLGKLDSYRASLVAQRLKRLPAMRETWVRSLGQEDPLEKEMATHSSTLVWRIPVDRGAWQTIVHGVTKSWTRLSNFTFTYFELIQLVCPKLICKELDTTEQFHFHFNIVIDFKCIVCVVFFF